MATPTINTQLETMDTHFGDIDTTIQGMITDLDDEMGSDE